MSEYRMIQGFAPMMREVIRVKRMPPWHADPEIGEWQHSAHMSDEDTRPTAPGFTADFPFSTSREVELDGANFRATRMSFVGELGYDPADLRAGIEA